MASIEKWKIILDKAEGQTWDASDVGPGDGTHYGVSAGSLKTATGKTVTQSWLKSAKYDDPLIQATIDWHWTKAKVGDLPQDIANNIADFLFNKGMGRARIIQNMLITRYGADIEDDGQIGALTIGALKAAIDKYGEEDVYNAIYAWRYAFYTGVELPNQSGHVNGKSNAKYYALANSRLNRYYPQKGATPVNVENYLKPIDATGVDNAAVEKAAAAASISGAFSKGAFSSDNPDKIKNILLIILGVGAIGGLIYFLVGLFTKGSANVGVPAQKVTTVLHVSKART